MNRRAVSLVTAAWLIALLGLVSLNSLMPVTHSAPVAEAQSVPQDSASPLRNDAEWVVAGQTFTSDYPKGFHSTVQVSSSGGEIERARLIWNSATLRAGSTRQVMAEDARYDADADAFTASWEPDATMMLPPWSLLEYHWEFRDASGNEFETEPQQVEYEDLTRKWIRLESDAIIVYAESLPGEIEELVIEAMDQQKAQYETVWGALLPSKPRVVLFGDFDAWLEWRTADNNTSDSSFVIGQTFDQLGVIAQVVYGSDQKESFRELAYGTVLHETEHLYQAEFLSQRKRLDIPGWFMEGDATFFELAPSYDYLGAVRDIARAGELPPLLVGVVGGPRIDGDNPREGYDIGYSFFVWLKEQRGDLSLYSEIMALLAADVPFHDALEEALGMSTQEIERQWRVWLGASAEAPTLIPTWTPPPFLQPPTPMTFGG